MNEARELIKKIDKEIGDVVQESALLNVLKDQNTLLSDLKSEIEKNGYLSSEAIKELSQTVIAVKESQPEITKTHIVNQKEFKFPNHIGVNNLKDIEIPKNININNLNDYTKQFIAMRELLDVIAKQTDRREIMANLDKYKDANNPIAVRLTDGKKFYKALMTAIGGGGGSPFRYTNGAADDALIDSARRLVTSIGANLLATSSLVGQVKIAITATAVQFPSNTLVNGVIVTANIANSGVVTLGGSGVTNTVDGTGNGYILQAGASVSFALDNTDRLYVNGTADDFVSFAGS